ncbi:MAG TPA: alpha/beta hydrolase [Gemmatimonadaceae bacterium]
MTKLRFATAALSTGPCLHYAEQGDQAGEPIIFLHGWPDSWFTFSRVLPLLPAWVHAYAPDQRGFGESDRPDTGYAIDNFSADAVAFLDAMGIERATFAGHSFGSFVARRVAIANPERVARLILIGAGVSASVPVTREAQQALQDLQDPVPTEFAREFQAGTAYAPLPESFFEGCVAESLKLPARLWREILDRLFEYSDADQLIGISAPTLLIWGEHDALFPRGDQDLLVTAIKGATLRVYEETGHCANWERPERVAADIHEFMQY